MNLRFNQWNFKKMAAIFFERRDVSAMPRGAGKILEMPEADGTQKEETTCPGVRGRNPY